MTYAFRFDSNTEVGFGHAARCSFISDYFKATLNKSSFFISHGENHIWPSFLNQTAGKLIAYSSIFEDATSTIEALKLLGRPIVLFVDSYKLEAQWERIVRPHVDLLIAIDDLANRHHSVDILIDCSDHRMPKDYAAFVEDDTKLLLGIEYCILPPHLLKSPKVPTSPNMIHLYFGSAVDETCVLSAYLALSEALPDFSYIVALGRLDNRNHFRGNMRKNDKLVVGESLFKSLGGCALAIGSPGIATWERAYLGIPGFYFATQSNQIDILKSLESSGFCRYLGDRKSVV